MRQFETIRAERDELRNENMALLDKADDLETEVIGLRAKLEVLREANDALQGELHAARKRQLPEGIEWPRFEDGALIRLDDEFASDCGKRALKLRRVVFTDGEDVMLISDDGNHLTFAAGDRVERPPLIAADGQPIEVGQTLFGESDGKAWTVTSVRSGYAWGEDAEVSKRLRPEWLTHEPRDTAERIVKGVMRDVRFAEKTNAEIVSEYVDRIEKLAGGVR